VTLQPLLDQMDAILPKLTMTKLKSDICFELGMLLARRQKQVHYEGLIPIDAVQAYNLLSQVGVEDPTKYAQAQTILDILCFERHVRVEKSPHYPEGPFVAVAPASAEESTVDELLERAMVYHRIRSGTENPHKDTVNKLAASLIDPGLSIQGIPGFTDLDDLAALNRFFDAAENAQQQRKALQREANEMAGQIAELEATALLFMGPSAGVSAAATPVASSRVKCNF
jgi:hypothetical protein